MNASNTSKPEGIQDELRRLEAMSDDDIDTSDIPEVEDWSQAERGKFYRANARHQIPVYLDAETEAVLSARAEAKGISLSDLTNEW